MTSTRLRSLFGRPCRKIDFQTCVSVSQFQNLIGRAFLRSIGLGVSHIYDITCN